MRSNLLCVPALGLALMTAACGDSPAAGPADAAPPDAVPAVCGDGDVEPPEVCDEGALNGSAGHCKADCTGLPAIVSVRGDVFAFLSEVRGQRVDGVKVSILEMPERSATTGPDAHFVLDGLEEGTEVTLVAERDGYVRTRTATFRLGPRGIDPFSIQVPDTQLFEAMRAILREPDIVHNCAIATTVTRLGGSLFMRGAQGVADAHVVITPAVPEGAGPVYFNEDAFPDVTKTATTVDGGAVFRQVPPGVYVITAVKSGFTFQPIKVKCEAGELVNAGPTLGIQAHVKDPDYAGGVAYPDDVYSAATDAQCAKTAACVPGVGGTYPDATLASCQRAMRNMLSWVDPACDAQAHVRDAWKAWAECRASSCESATGDLECVGETAAFYAAQEAYAPCFTAAHP